jgi:superfamily II DNA helicase RecQ
VGPALTQALGGTILRALAGEDVDPAVAGAPLLLSLEHWRTNIARQLAVPAYAVVTDAVLRAIAAERPQDRAELSRVKGVGPRTLAKFGDDLLHLAHSADIDLDSIAAAIG